MPAPRCRALQTPPPVDMCAPNFMRRLEIIGGGENLQVQSSARRPLQPVSDGLPLRSVWQCFRDDPLRARRIATVQLAVDRPGIRPGIARDDTDRAEALPRQDLRMGDDVAADHLKFQI